MHPLTGDGSKSAPGAPGAVCELPWLCGVTGERVLCVVDDLEIRALGHPGRAARELGWKAREASVGGVTQTSRKAARPERPAHRALASESQAPSSFPDEDVKHLEEVHRPFEAPVCPSRTASLTSHLPLGITHTAARTHGLSVLVATWYSVGQIRHRLRVHSFPVAIWVLPRWDHWERCSLQRPCEYAFPRAQGSGYAGRTCRV